MSDPAKTPEEIEDVLASVRRLVSDHAPKRESAAPEADAQPAPVPEAQPAPTEALVLTPSFRVTDPEDPWVPVATTQEPEDTGGVEPVSEAPGPEDLIAEIVTADAAVPSVELGDVPPQKGEAAWQPDDRMAHYDAVGGTDDEDENGDEAPEEWVDDHSDEASEEEIEDLIRLDGAEATGADFESETGDDNWPESGAEAALLTLVARRDPVAEAAEDAPEENIVADVSADVSAEALAADEAETVGDETFEDGAATQVLAEEPLDIERADETPDETPDETQIDDTPVYAAPLPDAAYEARTDEAPTGPVPAATPIFARVHDPVDAVADAPVEDLGDTPSPFTFPEIDEGILDEDTLREIIVEVVREELQGVLGQRITRNVRKMVRREIRLALAAEDLE